MAAPVAHAQDAGFEHSPNAQNALTRFNQALSERRANSVRSYLAARGVNQARMVAYGQGETQPVATNDTPEGRAANRRVELRITPATDG